MLHLQNWNYDRVNQNNTVSPPVRIFVPLYPHPYLFWDGVDLEKFHPNVFFKYTSLFIPRALSFFPCLAAQKTFFSYRNFWNKEFHFLKGKKLAILKKWHFRVNAWHFSSFGRTKNLFCFSQACFGLRAVFGIFWAFRRPSAFFRPKKSLKQPSGQNKPG